MRRCGRLKLQKFIFFVSLRYRLRVVEVDLEKNWINWVVVLHNWMEVKGGLKAKSMGVSKVRRIA